MILAFDTYYFADKAKTVCLQFENWADEKPNAIYEETLTGIAEYVSGEFYKRELPCILSLLEQVNVKEITVIVVDGFVVLDDDGKLGLGGYLYENLNRAFPVIGVAKTNFATLIKNKVAVERGESKRPLYITSIGIDLEDAAEKIQMMHGIYRIPTLLKKLDTLTKEIVDGTKTVS